MSSSTQNVSELGWVVAGGIITCPQRPLLRRTLNNITYHTLTTTLYHMIYISIVQVGWGFVLQTL